MKAKSALQSLRQGIVICDAKGCVVYVNAAYAEFTGIRPEEIRGKRIRDVRVGSLVPKVLHTGEAIEGVYKSDGERSYFASVYPIYEAGEKKGTVSIVTTLEQSRARKRPGGGTLKERARVRAAGDPADAAALRQQFGGQKAGRRSAGHFAVHAVQQDGEQIKGRKSECSGAERRDASRTENGRRNFHVMPWTCPIRMTGRAPKYLFQNISVL